MRNFGYEELDIDCVGIIMSDVGIEFKKELFYGDVVTAAVAVKDISRVSFDLIYLLKKGEVVVAEAKTGMVCFDYDKRKVAFLPETVKKRFMS